MFQYCSFALVLQLAICSLYVSRASKHEQSTAQVIRRVISNVIAAFPPAIPTVIVLTLSRCGVVLRQQQIHVHYSSKVKTAAVAQVLVLDKTGTLTGQIVRRISLLLACLLSLQSKAAPFSATELLIVLAFPAKQSCPVLSDQTADCGVCIQPVWLPCLATYIFYEILSSQD